MLKILFLWDVARCNWASSSRCFEGSYCLHLQFLDYSSAWPLWEPQMVNCFYVYVTTLLTQRLRRDRRWCSERIWKLSWLLGRQSCGVLRNRGCSWDSYSLPLKISPTPGLSTCADIFFVWSIALVNSWRAGVCCKTWQRKPAAPRKCAGSTKDFNEQDRLAHSTMQCIRAPKGIVIVGWLVRGIAATLIEENDWIDSSLVASLRE